MDSASQYAFGDSLAERHRLREQAKRLRLVTERFLDDAGIEPGMSVLELGSGTGEVTILLAERLGLNGRLVGLERSSAMLADARTRLAEARSANATLVQCTLDCTLPLAPRRHFDALVGRLVLTHLASPAATLERAVQFLKPGAIVAFQELDFTLCDHLRRVSQGRLPLVNQVCEWIDRATEQATMHRHMGLDLYRTFRLAGLPPPTIHVHTEVYGGLSQDRVNATVTIVRNLLPRLEQLGVSAERVDIDTLGARLTAETTDADAVQARGSIVSAWVRKP